LNTSRGSSVGPVREGRFGGTLRQRGLSLVSLVVLVVIIGFAAVIALRVVPTVVEYRNALSATKKAAAANTPREIQAQFDRSATIDDIDAIAGKDLNIQKVDDGFVVSFAYTKKIPLVGPVSLTIDYAGSSKSL
jgi:Tfp pilus assembly protein PilE